MRPELLSESIQDYLKEIYKLASELQMEFGETLAVIRAAEMVEQGL